MSHKKAKHTNQGNQTNHGDIHYKPVPEIVPPGIVTDPESGEDKANSQNIERLRGWNQQNKM